MPLQQHELRQFIGTSQYYCFSSLFRNFVLTDGTKYVADNGGKNGAYWLMDTIASYFPKVKHLDIQFWEFEKINSETGRLICVKDTGHKPIVNIVQETDFFKTYDEDSIKLWVAPTGDINEKTMVIYLPSEH